MGEEIAVLAKLSVARMPWAWASADAPRGRGFWEKFLVWSAAGEVSDVEALLLSREYLRDSFCRVPCAEAPPLTEH